MRPSSFSKNGKADLPIDIVGSTLIPFRDVFGNTETKFFIRFFKDVDTGILPHECEAVVMLDVTNIVKSEKTGAFQLAKHVLKLNKAQMTGAVQHHDIRPVGAAFKAQA